MSRQKSVLAFNVNGETIEGHPIGANKFVLGDVTEKKIIVNGLTTTLDSTGTVLFDRSKDGANRPWFIFDFETGKRIVKTNEI